MAKVVKSATNGSERRDGQQAVMAKRVAQAPTLQASQDLQATITDATSRNHHVSAIALQGDGSEGIVNRESVVTNMEVPDADAVKAANSAFFVGEEVLPNNDWTDLEPDRVQKGAGGPQMKTTNMKTLCKGFATTSLEDSATAGHKGREQFPWKRRWRARRWSEREHGSQTEQEVLTDQQHKRRDTRK